MHFLPVFINYIIVHLKPNVKDRRSCRIGNKFLGTLNLLLMTNPEFRRMILMKHYIM